jgi:tetratricopeptide (TPR) repeat protein
MRLKCLPNDHTDIADSYMFLGDVYNKKDSPNEAQSYYEKVLTIYEKKEHFNAIDVLNCIETIYENMRKYHLALQYYQRAFDFSEKYFSSNDLVKITNKNNINRVQPLIK